MRQPHIGDLVGRHYVYRTGRRRVDGSTNVVEAILDVERAFFADSATVTWMTTTVDPRMTARGRARLHDDCWVIELRADMRLRQIPFVYMFDIGEARPLPRRFLGFVMGRSNHFGVAYSAMVLISRDPLPDAAVIAGIGTKSTTILVDGETAPRLAAVEAALSAPPQAEPDRADH